MACLYEAKYRVNYEVKNGLFMGQKTGDLWGEMKGEKMENEEWRMKNEEWRMKNEEWRMKNGEWRMKNGEIINIQGYTHT